MNIFLFDIDGTLIHSGGAGKEAMEVAFEELYGIAGGLEGITLSGSTDSNILKDAFVRRNLKDVSIDESVFKERYFYHLEKNLREQNARRNLLPGLPNLLVDLQKQPDVHLGLLTGNWQRGAELKLLSFDLWKYFSFGAFADDNSDRNLLVPFALERVKAQNGHLNAVDRVFVIGDTPRDIQCARPHGAIAVAVATGDYSRAELLAEKPDLFFEDLSDIERVVSTLMAC